MFKDILTRRPTVAKKLLFWFLLVTLVPSSIFGYVSYRNAIDTLKKEVINNLITIADSKAQMIEAYIEERKKDVTALARTPTIIDATEEFSAAYKHGIDSLEYLASDNQLKPFLSYYQKSFGYHDLFLISSEGDVVFTVIREDDFGTNVKTGPYKNSELANVFKSTRSYLQTTISDFTYYPPSREPAAFIAAPVLKEGNFLGAVVFQIENKEAYTLMQDYTNLGETGETLIGSKIGNEAVFINPLRHDPQAAFSRKVTIGSTQALPIQNAVQGIEGVGFSIDYRGEAILAVWRYLPSPRWGMVVKIDAKEAFEPINRLRNWSLLIGSITILGVIALVLLVSQTISAPLMALHKGTEIIGSGNLDYRVGTTAKDEIGQLSRSFDRMTERLKATTVSRDELEQRVDQRTTDLRRSNKHLRREIEERKRFEEALKESERQLESLSSQLLTVQEDERKRVTQELHDSVGQTLAALKYSVENSISQMSKETLGNCITSLEELIPRIQNAVEEVERIGRGLHPSLLDDLGILATFSWFFREFESVYANIQIEKELTLTEDEVPEPLKVVFYRIVQESLNNIAKHSCANHVLISLGKKDHVITLAIQDNGKGFDLQSKLSPDNHKIGLGLISMMKRAELSGGSLVIQSTIETGTTIRASWQC